LAVWSKISACFCCRSVCRGGYGYTSSHDWYDVVPRPKTLRNCVGHAWQACVRSPRRDAGHKDPDCALPPKVRMLEDCRPTKRSRIQPAGLTAVSAMLDPSIDVVQRHQPTWTVAGLTTLLIFPSKNFFLRVQHNEPLHPLADRQDSVFFQWAADPEQGRSCSGRPFG
jgi:hypothetical protein